MFPLWTKISLIAFTCLLFSSAVAVTILNFSNGTWSIEQIQNTPPDTDFDLNTDANAEGDLYDESALANLDNVYAQIDATKPDATPEPPADDPATYPENGGYPATILPCTRTGDDLLVLVNKQYQLPADYWPTDLTAIESSGVRVVFGGLQVRQVLIQDLADMVAAAGAEGLDLAVLSAYRSYETQVSTYNYWVSVAGQAEADRISARPGHSQHQLGTAIDFTSSEIGDQLGTQFADSWAGQWMQDNSWKYGFALSYPNGWESTTGYSYEPWHFRYIGKANAAAMIGSGQILEYYLQDFL